MERLLHCAAVAAKVDVSSDVKKMKLVTVNMMGPGRIIKLQGRV